MSVEQWLLQWLVIYGHGVLAIDDPDRLLKGIVALRIDLKG